MTDAETDLRWIRERYADKRGHVANLLHEVTSLTERVIAEADARATDEIAKAKEQVALDLARAEGITEGRLRQALAQAEAERSKAEQLARDLATERASKLAEQRTASDEAMGLVDVTFQRPGGWSLGDLEDVAYRLRLGGAVDASVVEFGSRRDGVWATAMVADPSVVTLGAPAPPEPSSAARLPALRHWRLALAAMALIAGLLAWLL